jgi:hypothetical protein
MVELFELLKATQAKPILSIPDCVIETVTEYVCPGVYWVTPPAMLNVMLAGPLLSVPV